MKNNSFTTLLLPAIALAMLLHSCGGGGESSETAEKNWWVGEEKTEEDKWAHKVCDCMYNSWKSAGVNVEKIMTSAEQLLRDRSNLQKDDFEQKYKAELTEFNKAQAVDLMATECGKDLSNQVENELISGKINSDKYHHSMLNHCRLILM